MSLLPIFEPKNLHILDEALEARWRFDIVNNPLHPSHCPVVFLPFIAKEYDMDISLYTEAEVRDLLCIALWSKTKVGTRGAVKKAIETFDASARLVDVSTIPKRNGTIARDSSEKYTNYGVDHWAKYSIRLSRPMSLSQKEKMIALLSMIAPARCTLVDIDAQNTIIHDGAVKRNSTNTYGGYTNG